VGIICSACVCEHLISGFQCTNLYGAPSELAVVSENGILHCSGVLFMVADRNKTETQNRKQKHKIGNRITKCKTETQNPKTESQNKNRSTKPKTETQNRKHKHKTENKHKIQNRSTKQKTESQNPKIETQNSNCGLARLLTNFKEEESI